MSRHGSNASRIGTTMLAVILMASCSTGEPVSNAPAGSEGPTPRVHVLDDCPMLPCQGSLEPGEYRWTFSDPTIDFTIPSPGWTWLFGGGGFHLIADETPPPRHQGLYVPDGIYLLHDPTIASRDCEESSEPGVGRSVSDLVAWLETAPGLIVSEPAPVMVGGLEGMQLDIEIDPAWKRACFFSEGLPAVPLIFSGAELGGYHFAIVPDQSMRWYVLDSEDGVIIVNVEDDPGGLPRGELLRTGSAIVDSVAFS